MTAALWRRIANHQTVRRVLANSGWLLAERFIGLIGSLLIGGWVARYLGPEQFGTLNSLLALAALFAPLIGLGLSQVVMRELVRDPARTAELLGSALLLRLLAALLLLPIAVTAAAWLPAAGPARGLLWIALLGVAAQVLQEAPADLFRARLDARALAQAAALAQLTVVLLRLGLIVLSAGLTLFVWVSTLQSLLLLVLTVLQLRHVPLSHRWRWDGALARRLLRDAWPLMLSGLAVLLYMKLDQIMLQWLIGGTAPGLYAAAVRLSEVWYLVPVALSSSLLPRMVQIHAQPPHQHAAALQLLFDLQALLAYALTAATMLLAPLMIELLFGAAYRTALPMLWLHLTALLFVALGLLRNQWLSVTNRSVFTLTVTAFGALLNFALNLWWIPRWGGLGAAAATVAAQLLSSWLSSYWLRDGGLLRRCQMRAVLAPLRLRAILRQLQQSGREEVL